MACNSAMITVANPRKLASIFKCTGCLPKNGQAAKTSYLPECDPKRSSRFGDIFDMTGIDISILPFSGFF